MLAGTTAVTFGLLAAIRMRNLGHAGPVVVRMLGARREVAAARGEVVVKVMCRSRDAGAVVAVAGRARRRVRLVGDHPPVAVERRGQAADRGQGPAHGGGDAGNRKGTGRSGSGELGGEPG